VVEFYVRGEEFANHVFLFIVGIVSFFVSWPSVKMFWVAFPRSSV
jgi:hypothetical protein